MKFIKKHPIVIFFILLTILAFIFRLYPINLKSQQNKPQEPSISLDLPEGWTISDDTTISLKIQKQVESGYVPTITLIKSSSDQADPPKNYVDNLIAGAKSAIPSLRLVSDQRQAGDNYYSAKIESFYYNNKIKINSLQNIFIKDKNVYTLTASYVDDIRADVDQIFDSIIDNDFNL